LAIQLASACPDPSAEPSYPQQIDTSAQLGVICKMTEGALKLLTQIIDKAVKQDWPQN